MDYYVLLTGGKNNAGDFLIKHRAKKLLNRIRPDRKLIDFNAWEEFDEEKLEVVNNAQALILTGGPSLQRNMYPGIYTLIDNLDEIKVPIISMGIGWKSSKGNWEDIYKYYLSKDSKELVKRMAETRYNSSVRDYHTMHVLQNLGMNNVVATGCPALYDLNYIGEKVDSGKIDNILFSLGVNFVHSKSMEESVKNVLLKLKSRFSDNNFTVMFHHSIDESYLKTPDANKFFYKRNVEFSEWLDEKEISYKDISGGVDDLIENYSKSDFHIGYRVHAHIFMSSISKPSILIAEDGRGKALRSLLGGVILDGYQERKNHLFLRALNKVGLPVEFYKVSDRLPDLILKSVDSEIDNGFPRVKTARNHIDEHFSVMENFLKQLP